MTAKFVNKLVSIVFIFSIFLNSIRSYSADRQLGCDLAFGTMVLNLAYAERTKVRFSSALDFIDSPAKEAEYATRDLRIQHEMNELFLRELAVWESDSQNADRLSYSLGRNNIGNDYFEIRGSHGARLFIKVFRPTSQKPAHIVIVGKATKKGNSNEQRVFSLMRQFFPDFPPERGNVSARPNK